MFVRVVVVCVWVGGSVSGPVFNCIYKTEETLLPQQSSILLISLIHHYGMGCSIGHRHGSSLASAGPRAWQRSASRSGGGQWCDAGATPEGSPPRLRSVGWQGERRLHGYHGPKIRAPYYPSQRWVSLSLSLSPFLCLCVCVYSCRIRLCDIILVCVVVVFWLGLDDMAMLSMCLYT